MSLSICIRTLTSMGPNFKLLLAHIYLQSIIHQEQNSLHGEFVI